MSENDDGDQNENVEQNDNDNAVSQEEFKAVKNKNDELLDELKEERSQRKELENRLGELESELSEQKKEKARKDENIEELEQRLEEEKQEIVSEKDQRISQLESELHELKVENNIKGRINEENVKPELQDMVESQLSQRAKLEDGEPVVTTESGEEPLDEYMDQYFEEKGEHIIAAPQNNGGGAGSAGGNGSVTDNPLDQAADGFSITQANKFVKESDANTVKQKLDEAKQPLQIDESLLEAGV